MNFSIFEINISSIFSYFKSIKLIIPFAFLIENSKFDFSSGIKAINSSQEKKEKLNSEVNSIFLSSFNLRSFMINFPLLNISLNCSLEIIGVIYSVIFF